MAESNNNAITAFYQREINNSVKRLEVATAKNDLNAQQEIRQKIADYKLKLNNYTRQENLVIADTIAGLGASIMPPMEPRDLNDIFSGSAVSNVSREHIITPEVETPLVRIDPLRDSRSVSKNDQIISTSAVKRYKTELNRILTLIGYNKKLLDVEDIDYSVSEVAENNIDLLNKMFYFLKTHQKEYKEDNKSYAKLNDPSIQKNLSFLLQARLNHWEKKNQRLSAEEERIKVKRDSISINQPLNPTLRDRRNKKKIQNLNYELARIKTKKGKVERKQRIIVDKKIEKELREYREMIYEIEKKLKPIDIVRENIKKNLEKRNALITRISVLKAKNGSINLRSLESERKKLEAEIRAKQRLIEKKSVDFTKESTFASAIVTHPNLQHIDVNGFVQAEQIAEELERQRTM